ncbi:MAG: helix-turn-helix domain-containing protein [Sulfolobales archaeon]|nr:helix-turn-helix domain-containing protein [Sulfolobales archaeon]MCX8198439.1 helix-turn-helix domain-containing protein [Sulfolobales archaeon]MDW8169513.1 helix-turn-helix domain-containing protein [Desulfurococcaceae archaeon]
MDLLTIALLGLMSIVTVETYATLKIYLKYGETYANLLERITLLERRSSDLGRRLKALDSRLKDVELKVEALEDIQLNMSLLSLNGSTKRKRSKKSSLNDDLSKEVLRLKILALRRRGLSEGEIAEKLNITVDTVRELIKDFEERAEK